MGVVEVEERKKGRRGRVEIGGTLSHARTMGRREEEDMLMGFERVTVGGREGRKDEAQLSLESSTQVSFDTNSPTSLPFRSLEERSRSSGPSTISRISASKPN